VWGIPVSPCPTPPHITFLHPVVALDMIEGPAISIGN
jgi:hypothetical protein